MSDVTSNEAKKRKMENSTSVSSTDATNNNIDKEDNNPTIISKTPIYTSEHFKARYNGPSRDSMTPEQSKIHDEICKTRPRTGISGPFGPWIAIPNIGQPSQLLGKACRYDTSFSFRESELVILLTGARHCSHTEFDLHQGEAIRAGLPLDIIQSIPRDKDFSLQAVKDSLIPKLKNPPQIDKENNTSDTTTIQPNPEREVALALFTSELLDSSTVCEDTYNETKVALGGKDEVLVEITAIVGYYTYTAYTLNVFSIPSKIPK